MYRIISSWLVSRKNNEKIEDLEWRKTFISKAKKYNTSIFPVFVEGFNSKNFTKWLTGDKN